MAKGEATEVGSPLFACVGLERSLGIGRGTGGRSRNVRSGGEDELTLPYALGAAQLRGGLSELVGPTAQDQHLQAQMVIEMHMGGGNDEVPEAVLDLGESLGESGSVVIVNQGESAGCLGLFRLAGDSLVDKGIAKKLADGLGPGSKLAIGAEAIKTVQKIRFQRDGETRDFRHCPPPPEAIEEKA